MFRRTLKIVTAVALAAISLALPTCISAEERDFVRYDAAKDEFHMLMLLQDIRVKDANDLDFLASVYENRDHLVAPAVPGAAETFPIAAFSLVRFSDSKVGAFNLFWSRPDSLQPVEVPVSLDSIKIHPGTFFLQDKKVGYYQAITVPGKTIDAALDEVARNQDVMVKGIQGEIDRRAGGGATTTWDKAIPYALAKTREAMPGGVAGSATKPEADDTAIEPMSILDGESLKNLKQALTDKKLRIRRDKAVLSLTLPLAPKDVAGVTELYKQYGALFDEITKNADATKVAMNRGDLDKIQMVRSVRAIYHTFSLTSDDKGLTISLDLLKYAQSLAELPAHRVDLNSNGNEAPGADSKPVADDPALDVAAFLRKKDIPLDEALTAEQIIKDFNAGTLKAYPSKTPVTPGQGIVASRPAPN
jgi:hypothetical protein